MGRITILLMLALFTILYSTGDSIGLCQTTQSQDEAESDTPSIQFEFPYYEPLPVEYVAEITNPDFASSWSLSYEGFDNSNPAHRISFAVHLSHLWAGSLSGFGDDDDTDAMYSYHFPYSQDFYDIVDFMEVHPDYFFNHSEFEGANPGYVNDADFDQVVCFGTKISTSENVDNIILKGVMEGEPVPEELQYVIDAMKAAFWDELVYHVYDP